MVLITVANPGTQQRYHVDNPINLFVLCQIIIQPSAFELLQRLAFYFVMQRSNDGKIKNSRSTAVEDGYEDDKEHSETLCGTCSGLYNSNEFWIGCDICAAPPASFLLASPFSASPSCSPPPLRPQEGA